MNGGQHLRRREQRERRARGGQAGCTGERATRAAADVGDFGGVARYVDGGTYAINLLDAVRGCYS